MQSTGHTSTQAVSFVSMHGSVMMNGMLASLRRVCRACKVDLKGWPVRGLSRRIIPDNRKKHHRGGRLDIAERFVERLTVAACVQRHRRDARATAPEMDGLHDQPRQAAPAVRRIRVDVV